MNQKLREEYTESRLEVSELLNIDVAEMFILQNLMRYPNDNLLAIELKQQLDAVIKHKMSTSTFYNKLKKLKTKGFVDYQQDERGKINRIEATKKAALAMIEIKTISVFATSKINDIIEQMLPTYFGKLGIQFTGAPIYERVLIIDLEFGKDIRIFKNLASFGETTYIVDKHGDIGSLLGEDLFKTVQHEDGKIFMPDNHFDAIIIIGYDCVRSGNLDSSESESWLQEAFRLVKKEGLIHISSIAEMKKTGHFLIDSMVEELHENPMFLHISDEQLISEMKNVGLINEGIYNYNGLLLGYGYKP